MRMRYRTFGPLLLALAMLSCDKGPALNPAVIVATVHNEPTIDSTASYPERFPEQVAVLLLRGNSGLVPARALKIMGIPFFCTRDVQIALSHNLVLIYPDIDGNDLSEANAGKIAQFVSRGGTVFAENVFLGPLKQVFGFRDYKALRTRHRLRFTTE